MLYAASENELLENLRLVLSRFQERHVLLNPDKVEIGLDRLEFVGHLLDGQGIHMTESKLDSIRNFPQPLLKRDLKQFIGLANYFRDHVRNHSILAHPLQGLLDGYSVKDRNHRIRWTDESAEAFENLKAAVSACQKLHFIKEDYPIHLETDASDYGIGGHLYQVTPTGNQPIMFISKSLHGAQCRWSTPEKEMFAIWYSLQKMDHLLRDREFHLHTDHENLTRIKTTGSPKVIRWQLDIQSYHYTIEHIKGENNEIADSFSRLCVREEEEFSPTLTVGGSTLAALEIVALAQADSPPIQMPDEAYRDISLVHNAYTGHHGVEKTLSKLVQQGKRWQYMKGHIKTFIKNCPACQLMSVIRIPIHTYPFTASASAPMVVINVDSIGPFPADDRGNTYILTVIDKFTRFIELYPISDVTAEVTAPALLDHIGRYGCPSQIQSDNGSQFVNDLIGYLVRLVGTEHVRTLAYSKEENAIVERANKEVLRHLRALTFAVGTTTDWSLRLPLVARILNSTVHESIGVSPASLLYGNMVNLDRGIFLPL